LQMALQHREPPAGLVHHSDRGSQYTADTYQALLTSSRIQASMSGTGNSFDNAHKESFFGTLKTELIHHRRYSTRAQARSDIFAYIEGFYNTRRRHSSLGYLSPNEFEAVWLARIR
jgi:putative transposase